MLEISDQMQAQALLKSGVLLCLRDGTLVYRRDDSYIIKASEHHLKLSEDDFLALYGNSELYIPEDESVLIDDTKDYDYYAYWKR